MPHSYLSLDQLKSAIAIDDTNDDTRLRAVLEAVSRFIDERTGRRFQPYTATKYYTPITGVRLEVDDLLSVDTLKTDDTGDRDYDTTWASDDYDLLPFNAQDFEQPYTAIQITPDGDEVFPVIRKSVEITGTWGYWEDLSDKTTLDGSLTASATSVTVADGSTLEALQTIKVDSEQMYVTSISSNTLTVERGVNGTTAASHSDGATVAVYRYPGIVVEATMLQATRLFRRKDVPFGMEGSADVGMRTIPKLDPDVKALLNTLTRYHFGAV